MSSDNYIATIGENQLIKIIEDLIFKKTGEILIRDDAFFFNFEDGNKIIIFNSDMFISTTDAPVAMNYFQMGYKSIIMNLSDLIVKGVKPRGVIVSLGLPSDLLLSQFEDLINGIVSCVKDWNLKYIGGDLNKSKEIIINPMVFGFKTPENILKREGIKEGDFLLINSKFGLTGVGFDILLKKKGNLTKYPKYTRSIESVLNPQIAGKESYLLSNKKLASASIDSSDGLVKSLRELMVSNVGLGFEIEISKNLIDPEALAYANENNILIENLILKGGEEFIHLFTISPKNYKKAIKLVKSKGGSLIKVGKVISEEKIYFIKNEDRIEIKSNGYDHFNYDSFKD